MRLDDLKAQLQEDMFVGTLGDVYREYKLDPVVQQTMGRFGEGYVNSLFWEFIRNVMPRSYGGES